MNTAELDTALSTASLPKWPQMLVSGKSVTVEQAKDIIFRTDPFLTDADQYSGGNNQKFNQHYRDISGLTRLQVETKRSDGTKFISTNWELQDRIKKQINAVSTAYVRNDWASSSYIFGPHGWCHPDGTIWFEDNVGKWPSVQEILQDWQDLAAAFPYLDLHISLMNGESGDESSEPVVNIRVENGQAYLAAPDISVHNKMPAKIDRYDQLDFGFSPSREQGLPKEWYKEFAAKIHAVIDTFNV